jgi:hypothetical protein
MSEEVSDRIDGAIRNFIGAIAFVLLLIGAELMAEKEGQRFYPGLALVLLSLPFYLSAAIWRLIKGHLAGGTIRKLASVATDVRWWLGMLGLLVAIVSLWPFLNVEWTFLVPIIGAGIIAVLAIAATGFPALKASVAVAAVKTAGGDTFSATGTVSAASPQAQIDGQTRLDLVHLLDFAVSQSTLAMLSYLIELASLPEVTDRIIQLGEHSDQGQQSKRWYIGYVGQQFGAGTHRRASFNNVIASAEGEAEHQLATMPEDKRLPGIDVLTLRRWMITDLQFTRTIQFLANERRELQDRMLGQRGHLIERLNQRQQGTIG